MRVTPTLDDSPIVPVRSVLRPSTYRALVEVAKAKGIEDVGTLLSRLADLSIQPRAVRSPRRRRRTSEEWAELDDRIRGLNGQRMSDGRIAKELGLAQPTVSLRRRGMGLESPTPRSPRGATA